MGKPCLSLPPLIRTTYPYKRGNTPELLVSLLPQKAVDTTTHCSGQWSAVSMIPQVSVTASTNNFNQHLWNNSAILLKKCEKYLCIPEFTFSESHPFKFLLESNTAQNLVPLLTSFSEIINLTKACYLDKLEMCTEHRSV